MRRKSGELVPSLLSIGDMKFDGRKCLTASRDITALKEVQRRAVESQATLGKIFEASSDAMMVTDFADNTVIAVNAEFTSVTGYTREEAVGHSLGEFKVTGR
jgi:PAS domain-containing protein